MPFDADEVGLGERFFIGGSNLRGFRYRESGPRDPDERKLAIGGSTRLTQRHELRHTFTERIRGRIFTAAAILEEGPFELGGPRLGSGVGVIMDLGPLTVEFDLAIPVVKKSGDKPQYFYVRLGSDF